MAAPNQGFNYNPRPQFLPYHNRKQRYAVLLCHRRAGKSYATLNDIIVRALTPRPDGLRQQFALMAPTQKQARTIAWQYLKEQTQCFEGLAGYKSLEQHLTITLPDPKNASKPGSTIMLVGAENAESLRGLFLDGIVIDEAADIPDYVVTQIIRPALADRQGWLTIAGTVKSIDDYLWRTYELAQKVPGTWFSMILKASESGIIQPEELHDLRHSMTEEQFEVEFECNVRAAVTGKILLPYMNMQQITRVPYDPSGSPVVVSWDLGISDSMAIWLMQTCGKEPHVINHYQAAGKGFDHFVDWMAKLPYAGRIRAHLLPHDSSVRELGNGGKSRIQALRELGLTGLKKVPKLPKDMQIEHARMFLPMCWFDEENCSEGLKALRNYSFVFDPKRNVFSLAPKHDSNSNSADSFQYMAVGMRKAMGFVADAAEDASDDDEAFGGLSQSRERAVVAPYDLDSEVF